MRRDPRLLLKSISLAQRRADIELILDSLDRIESEIRRHARKAAGLDEDQVLLFEHQYNLLARPLADRMAAHAAAIAPPGRVPRRAGEAKIPPGQLS